MPAILRALPEGYGPNDRPDICERHFALQMRDYEQMLRSGKLMGPVVSVRRRSAPRAATWHGV